MNIENFVNISYPMIIQESKDKVLIFIPKLFIQVESDNLVNAFESCKNEKIKFYKRLEAIDGLHLIPSAFDKVPLRKRFDIQKILIERFFSFLLTLFLGIVLILILGGQISNLSRKINLAFAPTSKEKNETRLQRFKDKLNVLSPYIKEIKKVYNE